MHRQFPPANYLNAPLKRQQTKAVAGRKLKETETGFRDRRAQQEASNRADQERPDLERRHRETLSAIHMI
jgi:hypothetical protein